MAYPRFQLARNFKVTQRTAGTVAVNSTSWMDVDTATDIAIPGQVGDVLRGHVSASWGSEAFESHMTLATWVSGAAVNRFGGTNGVAAWLGFSGASTTFGGSAFYTLVPGDIVSGIVTLRLQAKVGSAGSRSLFAGTGTPLQLCIQNLGPADPN